MAWQFTVIALTATVVAHGRDHGIESVSTLLMSAETARTARAFELLNLQTSFAVVVLLPQVFVANGFD
ncbi:hypothetical protein [Rhodoferax sp.]|uniref:hypothetical protein n=1 Tax=Rhodoferax sp. TaxID=50421 RepID=UPI0027522061|nr:hypothetical protein [Rhodoferax sp.]